MGTQQRKSWPSSVRGSNITPTSKSLDRSGLPFRPTGERTVTSFPSSTSLSPGLGRSTDEKLNAEGAVSPAEGVASPAEEGPAGGSEVMVPSFFTKASESTDTN